MGHHILCLHCNMHPCVGFYLLVYFLFHWFSCAGASQHFAIFFIFHLTPQDDCVAGPSTLSICGQNYEIFSKLSYWSPQCFPLPYLSKVKSPQHPIEQMKNDDICFPLSPYLLYSSMFQFPIKIVRFYLIVKLEGFPGFLYLL